MIAIPISLRHEALQFCEKVSPLPVYPHVTRPMLKTISDAMNGVT